MNTLPDEQLDVRMQELLRPLPVFTLHDKGWAGLQNGEGFTHFVTADKNFPF